MRRWAGGVSTAATILASAAGGTFNGATQPDVAAWNGSDPHYVMVWRSAVPGVRDRHEIHSRVISREGQPVGEPVRVLDPGPDHKASAPKIAFSPVDGTFAMVWVDRRRRDASHPGSYSVRVTKLDASGRPFGGSHRISGRTQRFIRHPRIVAGGDGSFGVLWQEGRRRIAGRAVAPEGGPRGHEAAIVASRSELSPPALAGNRAGWFAVAWSESHAGKQAIHVRQFGASGLRPVHHVAGIGVRRVFGDSDRRVRARAYQVALGFDYGRLQDRLAWHVRARSGRDEADAIAAVPLSERSHRRLAKPVLLERDPPDPGTVGAFKLRMFARERAPAADVVWQRYKRLRTGAVDIRIEHRRVTDPWRVVGPAPEPLSSPDDSPCKPHIPGTSYPPGCRHYPNHPAVAGTDTAAPNTLYVWESDPYIRGVVR